MEGNMKPLKFILSASIIFFLSCAIGFSQTIADCSNLVGKAYYQSGDWKEDSFSGNRGIRILQKNGDDFDIFYGQPPGGKSVRKFGGNVIPLAMQNNVLQFLAADPAGLLELYLFDLNTKTMTLSQQSRMSPIIKTGTYVAKCK